MSESQSDSRNEQLRALWKSFASDDHPGTAGSHRKPTPEEILMQVKERARRFDRQLAFRDLRESAAGVFVIVVAALVSWQAPGPWPKIGCGVLALSIIAVLVVLRRSHRDLESNMAPRDLSVQVQLEIAKVRRQEQLLYGVARWYVAPLAAGSWIWMLSFLGASTLPLGLATAAGVALTVATAVLFAIVGWFVVRLNRLAIDRQLRPYRLELEAMAEDFEAA